MSSGSGSTRFRRPRVWRRGFTLDQPMIDIKDTTIGMAQLNVGYSNQ
jgi:hypothetical protein